MVAIHAAQALTAVGWQSGVRITFDGASIDTVEAGTSPRPGDERHDVALPGMPNLHSHAFQRGMAGLAEIRGPGADSFWSWRETMYRFALAITPDQVEAVAALLYVEMLEAGFTRVGEFHYLHHDVDGRPYSDIAEMAARIAAAAEASGIGLTLLPVFYAHSTFGGAAPSTEQRRFVNDLDGFARLVEGCLGLVSGLPGSRVGIAPHSLRAVTPDELASLQGLMPSGPIHIHVAEQVKEVEDCLAWSGARPVRWLLDHADVGSRWCLIHATHMDDGETSAMAESGAVAGLCPLTEANLGDGTFPAVSFLDQEGRFGVGSDSNVLVSLTGELQQLEYSQRLVHRTRNALASSGGSTGMRLCEAALAGGSQALGAPSGRLQPGGPADIVTLQGAGWLAQSGDRGSFVDSWIFARGAEVRSVWVAGRQRVVDGRHVDRRSVERRAAQALAKLR